MLVLHRLAEHTYPVHALRLQSLSTEAAYVAQLTAPTGVSFSETSFGRQRVRRNATSNSASQYHPLTQHSLKSYRKSYNRVRWAGTTQHTMRLMIGFNVVADTRPKLC